jgi:hypothetical protein
MTTLVDGHDEESVKAASQCPRCGYDQRGVVATWVESCPLRGVCTECGLAFAWTDLMNEELAALPWCVEYAPRGRFVAATARTLGASCLPWRFWRRLTMAQRVRPGRIAAYVLVLCLLPLALIAVMQATAAVLVYRQTEARLAADLARAPRIIADLQSELRDLEGLPDDQPDPRSVDSSSDASGSVDEPLPIQTVGQSRAILQLRLAGIQQNSMMPPSISMSLPAAVWEALLVPWSSASKGVVSYPMYGWKNRYYAPRYLLQAGFGIIGAGPSVNPDKLAAMIGGSIIMLPLFVVVFAGSFLLLPVTRRRCKVRWVHIVRVALYGAAIPVACLIAAMLMLLDGMALGWMPLRAEWSIPLFCFIAPGLLLVLWWSCAIKLYLKMPRAIFVAVLLGVMSVLMTPVLVGLGVALIDAFIMLL